MKLSKITREQALSIVKNAALAGLAAVLAAVMAGNTDYKAIATLGFMALLKTIEKAFTQA